MEVFINDKDRILVVAPHADDESIGCGGLLSLYGGQCDLMLLTDGRKGHTTEAYQDENLLISIRKQEFTNAAEIAGVKNVIFLDIEDGTVTRNKQIISNQDISVYDYIFVPNRYESHPDHSSVCKIFKKMKQKQRAKAKILEYEVWTPLRHATWFLDITEVADSKKRMISQHKSQLADIDYVEKGMALSCYRGMFYGNGYAEAYLYTEFYGLKKLLYQYLPNKIKSKIKKAITADV